MKNYFELYINRDIRSLFPGLDIIKYRRVLEILTTVSEYIDIVAGTYFGRNLPAYKSTHFKAFMAEEIIRGIQATRALKVEYYQVLISFLTSASIDGP